jgi:2-keto-4-pentenoate hydratase/2-oxohepta-3-ene-1,7-dioic acid hydratase in catechol pathway
MKWCRFQSGNKAAYGIIEGDHVIEVSGSPFDSYTKTSNTYSLGSVKLLVPVVPPTFYAAGINYPEHVTWAARMRGEEPNLPKKADVGYRANNALIAHEEPIIVPKDATEMVQYEGELVVVMGKECKNVSEANALDYVLGYTIGNDVSERTWQRGDRTMWRAKNTDTFKPMGPWIVTGLDPDQLHVKITLSGRVVGEYDVKTAIFGVRHYISEMSKYLTLYPGDVLWMGTDGATENMKDGDVCEIEISDIGVLCNQVKWAR